MKMMMMIGRREWRFWGRWCEMVGFFGLLGWGNGRGGGVEFGMFSGLSEVMDLVWRLLMERMERLLGDGTRWKIYVYSCSNTFSLSLSLSL